MAAYFVTTEGGEFCHHINTIKRFNPENIESVQLDGDELEYVRANMTNIPMHRTKRIVTMFGDDAKFIAANWD